MDRLRLKLLGEFELRAGPLVPRIVPTRKAQALLAYLALNPGVHPRDKLAALLWPDAPPGIARKQLRQTLFVVRKVLSGVQPALVAIKGDAITLVPGALETDVAAFEQAVAGGSAAALEEAADLYRGDLLAGLRAGAPTFDDWLTGQRERLREVALQALDRLLLQRRATGANGPALAVAARLLALNPVHERTHRALMRIHLDRGDRDAARRQYGDCVEILRRELGVEPEAETRELYEEIGRQRVAGETAPVVAPGASRLPLVGRDVEAARLQQALTDAWTGRGAPVVAVVGEAGVGKTRLLTALAAEAERRGGAVLLGRSYETEGILPLGPWVSAVREAGVLTQRRALDRLDGATRAQLARVFPELLPAGAGAEAGESRDADRLFDALRGLLRCLALAQPLAVVLEDIHWADGMTVDCLAALARRWDGAPLLVAVSAREEELDPSTLRVVLDELHREQRLARQALAPLGHDDTVALIRGLGAAEPRLCVADAWTEAIWERSGGNPFIVMETVRAIADGGDLDLRERLPLPARVREMIGRHLAGLSGAARHLVGVAAVIGRQFDMDLLRRGAGLEARLTTDALEELIRRRVVHAVGNRFDFIHERVREVALAEVLPPRRQLLHAAVTVAMGARPGPDA